MYQIQHLTLVEFYSYILKLLQIARHVVHTCNSSTWKDGTIGLCEFEASLGFMSILANPEVQNEFLGVYAAESHLLYIILVPQ